MKQDLIKQIVEPLVKWFQENKRELPWRQGNNPYHTWLSEIMLQQTRIEAVKEYYAVFLKKLPTIQDLAKIEEERLLKLWEGLGYYNRVRNLKKAAQIIEREYHGIMPTSYEELVKLPGIGEYTAGAIASICFGERIPAVDGNVLRVISRVIGSKKNVLESTTKKEMTELLQMIIPKEAGDFNEGLMELGETICIPNGEPLCEKCPLKKICTAKKENLTNEIPVRVSKMKRKIEDRTVFLLFCGDKIAIRKREDKGLLAGMYEFPNITGKMDEKEIKNFIYSQWGMKIISIKKIKDYKHIFSHIEWKMRGYHIEIDTMNTNFIWVPKEKIRKDYAIPGAFAPFQEKL